VAALNHPNIVMLHSVEEYDGLLFLTMELVEGQPLRDLIPRGGVRLEDLLRLAIDIAAAIAAAQQRGITHRDLKPLNVIVADGRRTTCHCECGRTVARHRRHQSNATGVHTCHGLRGIGRVHVQREGCRWCPVQFGHRHGSR
jgi:serine/threonine protein kinase